MNKKFYLYGLIALFVIMFIYYIYKYIFKKAPPPPKVDIPAELLSTGTYSDAELKVKADILKSKLTGVTIYESEILEQLLIYSDVDLIRLYNIFNENYQTSLYVWLTEEDWWLFNESLWQSVKQRFINLHINN